MLTIQLFGNPTLEIDRQVVNVERRKSRAMLYYLADSQRPVQREHLLALFWPDTDRSSAQQILRTTLHGLRKALGEALVVDRDTLGIAPDVEVDARMFEKNLAILPADILKLSSILDLYQGPFLEDFSLPDSAAFDEWLETQREHYKRLALRAISALSRLYETHSDYKAALACLDRALTIDPLQEDFQREAMRLAYLAGDRPDAIRRYDQLRKLLDEELGMPPMVETRAMYDDILNDHIALHPARAESPPVNPFQNVRAPMKPASSTILPFRGHDKELKLLTAELFSHRLLLVEGEPGIGKTRLVEQLISTLPETIHLTVVCRELEQSLPYQPMAEALRILQTRPDWPELFARIRTAVSPVWLAQVARLAPELDPGQAGSWNTGEEWRLWEGLSQFLLALAQLRPVVFWIDDAPWADASTLGLVGYLVRHSDAAQFGFLATAQAVPARSALGNLISTLTREGRLLRLSLDRFTEEDVAEIARQISPDHPEKMADWLLRSSEGNPYILTELVRHARKNRWLQPDGTADFSQISTTPVVPPTVYSLIQTRLSGLPEAARRLLDVAVAAGRDFELDAVMRASALSEEAALDGLDELLQSGLVVETQPGRYAFDHSLTMEVAYREVGEARHRLLHRRLAEAMENVYRPSRLEGMAGVLAFHFSEGNDPQRAAPYALKAGRQAADLSAWHEAIDFYKMALAGIEGWERYAIWMELGRAYLKSGQGARATEVFRSAADLARARSDRARLDEARLMTAQSLLPQARFAESIEENRKVLEEGLPENAFQAELGWGTALSLEGADLAGAEEHLMRAASFCRGTTNLVVLAQVEFELGSLLAQRGNLPGAVEHYRQALQLTENRETSVAVERRTLVHNNLAYHLLLLEDPEAEAQAQAGMHLAKENGLLGLQTYLYSTLGEIALARKDYAAAEAAFNAGLEIARQLSMPERITGLTANLGLVARELGQTSLAIHRLSTAMAQADSLGILQLSAQIRLWLVPLLPGEEAHAQLAEARAIAASSGRKRLLEEADRMILPNR